MENQILGKERIFIIAEIGNNHNGSLERAIEMVDQCKEIGVDCVKFQMRDLAHTYRKRSLEKSGDDLGTEYVVDLLKRFELTIEEQKKLRDYSKSKDLIYLCTPWDLNSIDILESFKVDALFELPFDYSLSNLSPKILTSKEACSCSSFNIPALFGAPGTFPSCVTNSYAAYPPIAAIIANMPIAFRLLDLFCDERFAAKLSRFSSRSFRAFLPNVY